MFRPFERWVKTTALPGNATPPAGLVAFYWHFARQTKGVFVALFAVGFAFALLDVMIPVFIGQVVTLVTHSKPEELFAQNWPLLAGMAFVLLILRPAVFTAQQLLMNQAIAANVSNRIRWQNHWHVVRQSWSFFQNDFAGRIANRVMQTGPAIRESLVQLLTAVWFILIYGTSSLILLASADRWLALPIVLWFAGYVVMLRWFVPRMRDRSKMTSESRSQLTGRIVDTYTNIVTVKLFARPKDEDAYVREAVDHHTGRFLSQVRLNTLFGFTLVTLNALLITGTGAFAIVLWRQGHIGVGVVAMALPMTTQIVSASGWVAWQVTGIFENIGVVQEGMMTIARPLTLTDEPGAAPLTVTRGEVRFDHVRFGYGRETGLIDGLSLDVRPGEKIGLVGRSGAGKSTLVNLLLRFFDLEGGRILIDGQDIAAVTQESLRAQISVVTQDTSLLHRSIRDNIRYGRPGADRGRDRRRRADGACAGLHPRTGGPARPPRLRRPCRRARRQALRRPAPARRHRPRHPQERADPGARRGDLRARQRGRGGDPVEPRHADARQDRDRHRAPALHHRADGPAGGARPRPHRRTGHA